MNQILRDAIESARTCKDAGYMPGSAARYYSAETIRGLIYAVVRELPDDMTAAEIRDELEIANNQ
jgi:hypothetical protein